MIGTPINLSEHLVLDIETLGIEYGSTILSIGAVCGDSTYYAITDARMGKAEFDTLKWWHSSQVSKYAFDQVFFPTPTDRISLETALKELVFFIAATKPKYFWGCSPDFDFGHLEHWMKQLYFGVPWKYWQLRDIRTIKSFLTREELEEATDTGLIPHVAIDDAKQEALYLKAFLEKINKVNNKDE